MERASLVWNYGKTGAVISGAVSAAGTGAAALLGGWDRALRGLLLFMALDFALGVLAAVKNRELDSRIAFWGGVNKILVLCFVAVGVVLDGILPLEQPYCRTAIVFFYVGREGLSMIENYGRLGGQLPGFLRELLAQLQEANSQQNNEGEKEHNDEVHSGHQRPSGRGKL